MAEIFSTQTLIFALLGLPLVAASMTLILKDAPVMRDAVSVGIGILTGFLSILLFIQVRAGTDVSVELIQFVPGVSIGFTPEPLGALFALVAGCLWPLATLYSAGYMRGAHEANQTRFFFFYAVAIHAAMGIALADGLATLFIFYEIMTFATYPLVTHKGNADAKRSGRIYLGILVTSSVAFLLVGIIGVWTYAGTLEFIPGGVLEGKINPAYLPILLALFAFGIGKAALMPLHRWLPAAMVAPTPVSALLHAVAVVKAGVFSVLKVAVYIFGIDFLFETGASDWLIWVACFTLISASIVAISKTNLKARLAYSTISQLAYVVLGAALATNLAAQGAALHIIMHAAGKITLFFCAGAIYVAHHKIDIADMNGLGRKMPITFACFALGALSIMGIPPLGGSWSKFMLMAGALDAGHVVVILVLMVSSLLNVYYLGQPVIRAFFAQDSKSPANGAPTSTIEEAPLTMLIPLTMTAIASIALFFFADYFILSFNGAGL
jgi:multicomponent Na+:H+ antiporter subunit D